MSAVDNLIEYIKTLTPEQASKAIDQLPQLIEAIEAQEPPCPPAGYAQSQ